ncbi:oncostatin-M-specific receptor subunit beta [Elgaria multicarinata webbii]|uniref:oncostatin-M-specific receptor subunit beta n=1 Tax=Elgaria multicarinata webbii TaxID=159646 RepID=UPI002FCD1FCC
MLKRQMLRVPSVQVTETIQVKGEGNSVLQLTNLNISMDLPLQMLLVEWDVTDDSKANLSGTEVVFNIQVYRTEENNIVFSENYGTTLNKSDQPLKWSWYSEVRLECVIHGVRVRGRVTRSEHWSNWSPWGKVDGLNALSDSNSYIFPRSKIAEEGSSVTFCCIAKKNKHVTSYLFYKIINTPRQQRITFTEENVPRSHPDPILVACNFSDSMDNDLTYFYVTRQPDIPKDLSCETQDMVNLKCTWNPGQIETYNNLKNCRANFILSDRSSSKTYCNCSDMCQNSCSFEIGEQVLYNLSLTYKNCLGQKDTHLFFDVTNRVRPEVPSHLSSSKNATSIQLYWHINCIKAMPFLLCQIYISSPGVEDEQRNVTAHCITNPHISLDGLQPYTNYFLKVRCSAPNGSFWKWSKWNKWLIIQTNESAPSGQLDIWRDISLDSNKRHVTVFWKESPSFHANGKIKRYEIFLENLEEPVVSNQNNFMIETKNYTSILLDNHSYKISVSARNSVNTSSPSVIMLGSEENDEMSSSKETTDNNTANSIYISWKPQSKFDGYVVDWCNVPKSHPCDFQWMKFGRNDSSALISSEAFRPGVRYSFRVYGTQGDRSYLLEKKEKYLKELEPNQDLDLKISTVTSNSVSVTWKSSLQDSQPGFIRGYILYVKKESGNCTLGNIEPIFSDNSTVCRYNITDPEQSSFTVERLEPDTVYKLTVQAYSVTWPKKTGIYSQATTQSDIGKWFLQLLLPLTVVPLILLICMCFWKSDCVKNRLFPEIPRPDVTLMSKMSVGLLEISDSTPDKLIVMEKQQPGSLLKQPASGMVLIENGLYDPKFCPSPQVQQVTSKEPSSHLTSYQPLASFFISCSSETAHGNLNYISHEAATFSAAQQYVEWSTYKPQLSPGPQTKTPVFDENTHLTAAQR